MIDMHKERKSNLDLRSLFIRKWEQTFPPPVFIPNTTAKNSNNRLFRIWVVRARRVLVLNKWALLGLIEYQKLISFQSSHSDVIGSLDKILIIVKNNAIAKGVAKLSGIRK